VEGLRVALDSGDLGAVVRGAKIVLDYTWHGPKQTVEIEACVSARREYVIPQSLPPDLAIWMLDRLRERGLLPGQVPRG
jgi:hypothetical protein